MLQCYVYNWSVTTFTPLTGEVYNTDYLIVMQCYNEDQDPKIHIHITVIPDQAETKNIAIPPGIATGIGLAQ